MSTRSRTVLAVMLVDLFVPGCKSDDAGPVTQTSSASQPAAALPVAVPLPAPATPQPEPAAAPQPERAAVLHPPGDHVEVIRKPFDMPGLDFPCTIELFASTTLPAIAVDRSKLARLGWLGSSGAAESEGEVELLVFDANGSTLERVPLWHADDLARAESPGTCAALATELEQRRREANAVLASSPWRSLVHLPPLHELTAQKVVEVALVGGPTLAIRQPKVAVYAKLPMSDLRVPTRDREFAPECGSAPVLLDAWRDPIRNTLLLEFTGEGYVSDVCDYAPVFQVVSLRFDEPPPSDAAWGRAPTWLELESG